MKYLALTLLLSLSSCLAPSSGSNATNFTPADTSGTTPTDTTPSFSLTDTSTWVGTFTDTNNSVAGNSDYNFYLIINSDGTFTARLPIRINNGVGVFVVPYNLTGSLRGSATIVDQNNVTIEASFQSYSSETYSNTNIIQYCDFGCINSDTLLNQWHTITLTLDQASNCFNIFHATGLFRGLLLGSGVTQQSLFCKE